MGLILFIVLIVAAATWYLHLKRKEKQEFLDRYKRYRMGDKGAFIGFNRFELKPCTCCYNCNCCLHDHNENIYGYYDYDYTYSGTDDDSSSIGLNSNN